MKFLTYTFSLFLAAFFITATTSATKTVTNYSITATTDQAAQFPGGEAKMNAWIKENLRFPEKNVRYGIVRVVLTVKKNGKCADFTIKKGINEDMDIAAIECLEGMPFWEPAVKDGKKVNSTVVISVKFTSDDK